MHAMGIDDAYRVKQVLARGTDGMTELVTLDGSGLFVRKRIALRLARRSVWAALADCGCDRLPHVEATYEMPEEFVVVYDFVPGDTLERVVELRGRLSVDDALRLVVQVCEAAGALHARGVIHRDISPTNVIVAVDGARLIDLGIARMRVEGVSHDTTSLGTWGFASPEQYGFAQTDARSDVYSIGRLFGYMLTGVRPDADEYEGLLADATVVPSGVRTVIDRACAFEPSARYQSAAELASAVGALADGGAAAAPRPSRVPADLVTGPVELSVKPERAPLFFYQLSLGAKIVFVAVCSTGAVVALLLCFAGIVLLVKPALPTDSESGVLSLAIGAFIGTCACWDFSRLLRRRGRYAVEPSVARSLYVRRMLYGLGLLAVLFFLLVVVVMVRGAA